MQRQMTSDIVIAGHISRDIMIDFKGHKTQTVGGAVVYASAVFKSLGVKATVVSKLPESESVLRKALLEDPKIHWILGKSKSITSIRNVYLTQDKEKREVTLLSQADPFTLEDLEGLKAPVFYLAGLFAGEMPDSFIKPLAAGRLLAVDAQGLLRRVAKDSSLRLFDWPNKTKLLKYIAYFKADAAEAEVLTGFSDRFKAIRQLALWGPKEIMLTHNSEVLLLCENKIYRAPYTNKNNSGRTGRGDTTFSSYLAWRKNHSPQESVSFAAALCSIKMEAPGVFKGTVKDVLKRMEKCSVEELS